jgi:hypothetical protein
MNYMKFLEGIVPRPDPLWFVNKTYGWGWVPVTWQGWLSVGIYAALTGMNVLVIAAFAQGGAPVVYALMAIVFQIILTAGLMWFCYRTGEKPEWRWGGEPLKKD